MPEPHAAAMASLKAYSGEVPIPRFSFGSKGKLVFKNVAHPVEMVSVGCRSGNDFDRLA